MDISLVQGTTTIVVNGTGASAPLRAGRAELANANATILEIALDGSAAAIAGYIQSIERLLYLSELWYGLPGEAWGYIQVTLPDSSVWRSPIRSGLSESAAPGASARAAGSQGLRVKLARDPYWESATLSDVPLTNRNGTNVTAGLAIDNHDDAGHDNWVQLSNTALLGDVPAPVVITLSSTSAGLEYLVGQAANSGLPNGVLEAEDGTLGAGVTGSLTADAACSGGYYRPLGWSGASAVQLLGWDLGSVTTGSLAGRVYRPVLRLRDLISGAEQFWLWWRAGYYNGASFEAGQDFEGVMCSTTQKLVACPPMPVPPWPRPPGGFTWESASLMLMCQAAGARAHALNLDFAQLLPTEGWVRFLPVLSTLSSTSIRYDCGTGQISRGGSGMASHAVEGAGFPLYPGLTQKIFILAQAGGAMDPALVSTVKLQYRQRKRVL